MDEEVVKRAVAAINNFQREFVIIQTHPHRGTHSQMCSMMEQILPHLSCIRKMSRKNPVWKLRVLMLEQWAHRVNHADIMPTKEIMWQWLKRCDQVGRQYLARNSALIESLYKYEPPPRLFS